MLPLLLLLLPWVVGGVWVLTAPCAQSLVQRSEESRAAHRKASSLQGELASALRRVEEGQKALAKARAEGEQAEQERRRLEGELAEARRSGEGHAARASELADALAQERESAAALQSELQAVKERERCGSRPLGVGAQ